MDCYVDPQDVIDLRDCLVKHQDPKVLMALDTILLQALNKSEEHMGMVVLLALAYRAGKEAKAVTETQDTSS